MPEFEFSESTKKLIKSLNENNRKMLDNFKGNGTKTIMGGKCSCGNGAVRIVKRATRRSRFRRGRGRGGVRLTRCGLDASIPSLSKRGRGKCSGRGKRRGRGRGRGKRKRKS